MRGCLSAGNDSVKIFTSHPDCLWVREIASTNLGSLDHLKSRLRPNRDRWTIRDYYNAANPLT
jgi:hypothetical protein